MSIDYPTPLQISYTDPDGFSWDLSDQTMQNGYICTGIAGIEGIPVMSQLIPLLDGTARTDLFMAQPGGHKNPSYIAELIQQQGITVCHFVPS